MSGFGARNPTLKQGSRHLGRGMLKMSRSDKQGPGI